MEFILQLFQGYGYRVNSIHSLWSGVHSLYHKYKSQYGAPVDAQTEWVSADPDVPKIEDYEGTVLSLYFVCCTWPNVHLPPFFSLFWWFVNLNLFSLCYRKTERGTDSFLPCGGRIKAWSWFVEQEERRINKDFIPYASSFSLSPRYAFNKSSTYSRVTTSMIVKLRNEQLQQSCSISFDSFRLWCFVIKGEKEVHWQTEDKPIWPFDSYRWRAFNRFCTYTPFLAERTYSITGSNIRFEERVVPYWLESGFPHSLADYRHDYRRDGIPTRPERGDSLTKERKEWLFISRDRLANLRP